MSDHMIRWEYSTWSVTGTLVCTAALDADCHLTSTCGCEEWGEILTDETGGKYHRVYDETDDESTSSRHYMKPAAGYCNIAEWLNATDLLDEGQIEGFTIAETPVEVRWTGGDYAWKVAG